MCPWSRQQGECNPGPWSHCGWRDQWPPSPREAAVSVNRTNNCWQALILFVYNVKSVVAFGNSEDEEQLRKGIRAMVCVESKDMSKQTWPSSVYSNATINHNEFSYLLSGLRVRHGPHKVTAPDATPPGAVVGDRHGRLDEFIINHISIIGDDATACKLADVAFGTRSDHLTVNGEELGGETSREHRSGWMAACWTAPTAVGGFLGHRFLWLPRVLLVFFSEEAFSLKILCLFKKLPVLLLWNFFTQWSVIRGAHTDHNIRHGSTSSPEVTWKVLFYQGEWINLYNRQNQSVTNRTRVASSPLYFT